MLLKTERLILRSPKNADIPDYLAICNSEFVLRYNAMSVATEEKVKKVFYEAKQAGNMLMIELATTGALVGVICIEDDSIRWNVGSKELSYFLGEQYIHNGYMREAMAELIRYLFDVKNVACITARAFVHNQSSRKLLETLGFSLDGVIPHCVRGYGGVIYDDALYSIFPSNK